MREFKDDDYIMCSDCGCYIKYKNAFIKTYINTGIILCPSCAKELISKIVENKKGKK